MDGAETLRQAIAHLEAGDWDGAHAVVQMMGNDPLACWLHALLHKIEGDEANARYWYGRCAQRFEDFDATAIELAAIAAELK